jgi:serine/threonine protein kinase
MTERELFTAALEIHEPESRAQWLRSACSGDEPLRRQVELLLRSHDDAGSFLEHSPLGAEATLAGLGDTARAGQATTIVDAHRLDDALEFLTPSDRPGVLGTLNHYDVLAVVGRGGMGVVLKALDTRLNRIVAVKVLAPEFAANPTARKRFLREAQAAAAVSHPHVVTIFAVEEGHSNADAASVRMAPARLPYLVMEFIAGQTLRDKIERQGALDLPAILRIGSQIACGLAAAHKQGLIHRDIKPANVLLENGVERVKLTDFGLARAVDDVSVTRTGEVAGTPQYMSPEQAEGHAVDHRSDLFSLGSVLYTMCTGRPPFRGETVVSVLRRVCDEQPRPIREINPDIPDWLCATIDRLLEKSPAKRFQSAQEVSDRLNEQLAQNRSGSVSRPQSPGVATPGPSKRWWKGVAVAAAVLLMLGMSEATGVTNFAGTVIRFVRGDGTLVVTIDDPEVSVSIEGEDLVITGAGAKEIRVPAGEHRLTFHKDGRPVDQQLVSVSRGGREIVTASFTAAGTAAPASSGSDRQPQQGGSPALAAKARLRDGDFRGIQRDLQARFPAAGVQLTLQRGEREEIADTLTIAAHPETQYQADAIHRMLTSQLIRRCGELGDMYSDGVGTLDPTELTLVDQVRPPAIDVQLQRLGVVNFAGQQPTWSPDGREIAFARGDGQAIEIANVITGATRTFDDEWEGRQFKDPAWSPDGRVIAVGSQSTKTGAYQAEDLWLLPLDNPDSGGINVGPGGYPNWVAGRRGGEPVLYFTSRGDGALRLKSRPGVQKDQPQREHVAVTSLYAAVSPDGRFVADVNGGALLVRKVEDGAVECHWPLPVQVAGMLLNWSPDSRYVAIAPYTQDYLGLWIYDTAAQEGQRIVTGGVKGAVWSPDGSKIALETAGNESRIWIIDVPTHLDRELGLTLALAGIAPPPWETIDLEEFETDAVRVVRGTKGQWTAEERAELMAREHPLFGQLADPHTKPLLELFAGLSAEEHRQGQRHGYLKWTYSELPADRRAVYRNALQANLDAIRKSGQEPPDTMSLEALADAQVGFAQVDVTARNARVLSWFILLPVHPDPIWMTVVNAKYAGTPGYFAAHHDQLNKLRLKPLSPELPANAEQPSRAEAVPALAPGGAGDADAQRLVELAEEELARAETRCGGGDQSGRPAGRAS